MQHINSFPEKKVKCAYCGNNQIPHFIYWYFESANVLMTPLRGVLLYNPVSRWLRQIFFASRLSFWLIAVGRTCGIVAFQDDAKKCKVRRAQVLWEEAEKRGIKMKELLLFGRSFDCYLAEKPNYKSPAQGWSASGGRIIFNGLPRPKHYDDKNLDWMDDKLSFKQAFTKASLPVPSGRSCWHKAQALQVFNQIQKPVVVKPRTGSRGRHGTTFISSVDELKAAFKIAKQLCFWVIVEEQLFGPVYRATLINYELCGVLRGDPPQVAGDGKHSIKELIEIKNSQPHPGVHPVKSSEGGITSQSFDRVKDIMIDENAKLFLSRQNLSLDSIPQAGQKVDLSEKIGVNYGGSSSEDFDICHSDNKELFIRAAKILGDPIVGFDFIAPDITKSWKEQKCGFIEANSLPFINLHHDPLHGVPRNVAAKVWEMLGW